MHWLKIDWWKYLFQKRRGDLGIIRTSICRVKGHPYGVIWFNSSGLEPNMHCNNCGDDLG